MTSVSYFNRIFRTALSSLRYLRSLTQNFRYLRNGSTFGESLQQSDDEILQWFDRKRYGKWRTNDAVPHRTQKCPRNEREVQERSCSLSTYFVERRESAMARAATSNSSRWLHVLIPILIPSQIHFNFKFKTSCKNDVVHNCQGIRNKVQAVACLSEHVRNDTLTDKDHR